MEACLGDVHADLIPGTSPYREIDRGSPARTVRAGKRIEGRRRTILVNGVSRGTEPITDFHRVRRGEEER